MSKRKPKLQIIETYESSGESENDHDSESNSDSDTCDNQNRLPKRKLIWHKETEFVGKEEAVSFVSSENIWSLAHSSKTSQGTKAYYRCSRVKRRGQQCDAALYLLYDNRSLSVHLYRTQSDHNCKDINSGKSQRGLTETQKLAVKEYFELNLKPKRINELLHQKNIPPQNINQINSYLKLLRTQKFGPTTISLGQLEQWCLDNTSMPDDIDF